MYSAFKRFIIGRPLATREFEGERLRKLVALSTTRSRCRCPSPPASPSAIGEPAADSGFG
jgi:hypothetical protein